MGSRGPLADSPEEAWLKGSRTRKGQSRAGRTKPVRLIMPADLEGAAAELWRSIVPRLSKAGAVTPADVPALADMCLCWQRLQEAEEAIQREGLIIEGYRGSRVKHPAASLARSYRESFQKWATRFGLSPADRQRLPAEPAPRGPSLQEIMSQAVSSKSAPLEWSDDPRRVLEG